MKPPWLAGKSTTKSPDPWDYDTGWSIHEIPWDFRTKKVPWKTTIKPTIQSPLNPIEHHSITKKKLITPPVMMVSSRCISILWSFSTPSFRQRTQRGTCRPSFFGIMPSSNLAGHVTMGIDIWNLMWYMRVCIYICIYIWCRKLVSIIDSYMLICMYIYICICIIYICIYICIMYMY